MRRKERSRTRAPGWAWLWVAGLTAVHPITQTALAGPESGSTQPALRTTAPFDVFEKSILELQAAQAAGTVTSRALVEAYIARIAAYDQAGPSLNAIVMLNPRALDDADALDRERSTKGARGPLHGIPVLVKDNYDTVDMPTSGGSLAFATLNSSADAFQVRRLREAGAVILGKTTLHELAAGITTVSSLTGMTRNPYDFRRVPGGSSGGTAAAIAASFAAAGLGTDTSGSIRIPAAFQNLVGLRATSGLSSRAGVMPLSSTQDIAGPMARSVTDLAILLDATVGYDPDDPTTAEAGKHVPDSYLGSLKPDGLEGARIGVVSALFGDAPEDGEVGSIVRKALDTLQLHGAQLVEVSIPGLENLHPGTSVTDYELKFDLADYLARHSGAQVASLGDIIDKGLHHEQLTQRLQQRNAPTSRDSEAYRQALRNRATMRVSVLNVLEKHRLDALAYPTIKRKPALVGEGQPGADAVQLSAATGLPAIAIPVGFTADDLPTGMELLGKAFTEPTLLSIAHGWEQVAKPRRPPFSTPPLVDGRAPAPIEFEAVIAKADASARAKLWYDVTASSLEFDASITGIDRDDVIAMTLQKGESDRPGPVIAHLIKRGQAAARSQLTLRASERESLLTGRMYLHLYTKNTPLGSRQLIRAPDNR